MKKPEIESQGKHFEVDTRNISPLNRAGGNIRNDYGEKDGSLQEMVDSIRENGVKEPLKAYRDPENKERWIAINGHTRLKACEILNKEGVVIRAKVLLVDARKLSDEEIITDMVVSNAGRPLKAIELAEAVRRMIGYGNKAKDIAKKWGKTTYQIKNLELLANAPKELRDLVSSGVMSATLVLQVFKEHQDFNKAVEVLRAAVGVAITKAKAKAKPDSGSADADHVDVSPEVHAKVTSKHVKQATNKVDSFRELQRVISGYATSENQPDVKSEELLLFAKKIANHRLIGSEIYELLFVMPEPAGN